jgi:hypothetical protein
MDETRKKLAWTKENKKSSKLGQTSLTWLNL